VRVVVNKRQPVHVDFAFGADYVIISRAKFLGYLVVRL
jgi:hypothetical protein